MPRCAATFPQSTVADGSTTHASDAHLPLGEYNHPLVVSRQQLHHVAFKRPSLSFQGTLRLLRFLSRRSSCSFQLSELLALVRVKLVEG